MIYIIIGCLAFVLLYIFDLNKVIFFSGILNYLFPLGIGLLFASALGIMLSNTGIYEVSLIRKLVFGTLSLVSLAILLSTLFLWLPFVNTYMRTNRQDEVIDTGMFALCRHPGVIWFFFLFLFLWLASDNIMMLWATIIWTVTNVLYVYIQDRWLFPKTFKGYETYKTKVPFLIPNRTSVHNCLKSFTKT